MDVLEDRDLAVRVAEGDRAALATVYDRYGDRLFDFCNSMLREQRRSGRRRPGVLSSSRPRKWDHYATRAR